MSFGIGRDIVQQMEILIAITILLACQLTGEALVMWFALPIPGPVVGMLLLLLVLIGRGKPSRPLTSTANALLSHLSLLFVPAGVGVIVHIHRLGDEWLPIVLALVLSTFITLVLTALLMSALLKISSGGSDG